MTTDTSEEIRRAFQAGRMDVLFNLVNEGKITIEYAAVFAGLSMEEAEDMLFGWRVAQESFMVTALFVALMAERVLLR